MKNFLSYLRSVGEESKGVDSSMRLVFLVVAIGTVASTVFIWQGLSIAVTIVALIRSVPEPIGLLPIPASVWALLSALLAIVTGGKLYQYTQEKDPEQSSEPQVEITKLDLRTMGDVSGVGVDVIENDRIVRKSAAPSGFELYVWNGGTVYAPPGYNFSNLQK